MLCETMEIVEKLLTLHRWQLSKMPDRQLPQSLDAAIQLASRERNTLTHT